MLYVGLVGSVIAGVVTGGVTCIEANVCHVVSVGITAVADSAGFVACVMSEHTGGGVMLESLDPVIIATVGGFVQLNAEDTNVSHYSSPTYRENHSNCATGLRNGTMVTCQIITCLRIDYRGCCSGSADRSHHSTDKAEGNDTTK